MKLREDGVEVTDPPSPPTLLNLRREISQSKSSSLSTPECHFVSTSLNVGSWNPRESLLTFSKFPTFELPLPSFGCSCKFSVSRSQLLLNLPTNPLHFLSLESYAAS
ncbi:hypothetical protein L1887_15555 [Cichorium endivia]|nr:hypothetical protein L1887_15555 [Cichorium endivia]